MCTYAGGMEPGSDPLAAIEKQAAKHWGVGSPQYRRHLAFAAWQCPSCDGPLVSDPRGHADFRVCERCRLRWFAQFSEREGSAKPGSMIAAFEAD